MRSLTLAAMTLLALGANSASALEIKNIRNSHAPAFAGATRSDPKILAGDLVILTYDIEGLQMGKGGKLRFTSTLELLDPVGKQLFEKNNDNEVIPQLGGTRVPGEINVNIPPTQAPGKYTIRMSITDTESKETKAFSYPFQVKPASFGFVGVSAPAMGLIGTYHTTQFALVHMKLDDKKLPRVDLVMRVLDEAGEELSKLENSFPRDLDDNINLGKANFLPWHYPIYLNRTGRFTIEITARDTAAAATATISYPFVVLDATTFKK